MNDLAATCSFFIFGNIKRQQEEMVAISSPLISVCVPARNASSCIAQCIDSVLTQTFTDFELLIADDGSEDDTCAVVERFNDARIKLFKRHHDFIATQDFLFDEARGKYIALIDSDDRMLPDRLSLQFKYMEEHPEIDALGANMKAFGENIESYVGRVFAPNRAITIDDMIEYNCVNNCI